MLKSIFKYIVSDFDSPKKALGWIVGIVFSLIVLYFIVSGILKIAYGLFLMVLIGVSVRALVKFLLGLGSRRKN